MQNHNNDTITTTQFLEKYTSHFIWKCCVWEGVETEQNCNILTPPLLWPSAFLSRSPGLLNRRPGSPASLLSAGFLYRIWSCLQNSIGGPEGSLCRVLFFSTASSLQTLPIPKQVWSPNSIGSPEAPFCRVLAFSTTTCLQLSDLQTDWPPVFTELYNSSRPLNISPSLAIGMCHFRRLWNVMFDRHQAEITVLHFIGHSPPLHQSVTVPWNFKPVPYCQPSSPTQWNMHFRVFGMACLAGSEINIQQIGESGSGISVLGARHDNDDDSSWEI